MAEPRVMLSARVSAGGVSKLEELAKAWRMPRSEVVRRLLAEGVIRHRKDVIQPAHEAPT